jgi:hypothetical protein
MYCVPDSQDLNYRVRNNAKTSERITLLHKVSGYLLPGHLSALVSSPASSSTKHATRQASLPDALTCRMCTKRLGCWYTDGTERQQQNHPARCGTTACHLLQSPPLTCAVLAGTLRDFEHASMASRVVNSSTSLWLLAQMCWPGARRWAPSAATSCSRGSTPRAPSCAATPDTWSSSVRSALPAEVWSVTGSCPYSQHAATPCKHAVDKAFIPCRSWSRAAQQASDP